MGSVRFTASRRWLTAIFVLASVWLSVSAVLPVQAYADTTPQDFSLQVSPSPLVATVKPGQTTNLDLQIRNTGNSAQNLKMGLRSFTVEDATGDVKLGKSAPADITQFVSFSSPTFSVEAGQIFTQHIMVSLPASAGFSYSFATTISQANPTKASSSTSAIQGSVAVFTLLSVDKPGAVRKLSIDKISLSEHVYEYLPATVSLHFTNSGNTLAQPSGTVFIQRHDTDTQPIASIPLNASGGYILPQSGRALTASWSDGFPHYEAVTQAGVTKQHLSWQGGDISKLRFGRYIVKVVAVYNDGQRDVPLNAEISFWVIPWRFLLVAAFFVLLLLVGVASIFRKPIRVLFKRRRHDDQKPKSDETPTA